MRNPMPYIILLVIHVRTYACPPSHARAHTNTQNTYTRTLSLTLTPMHQDPLMRTPKCIPPLAAWPSNSPEAVRSDAHPVPEYIDVHPVCEGGDTNAGVIATSITTSMPPSYLECAASPHRGMYVEVSSDETAGAGGGYLDLQPYAEQPQYAEATAISDDEEDGAAQADQSAAEHEQQPWPDAPPPTAVHAAAARGDIAYLGGAYDVGGLAAVDVPDSRGRTPLMHALRFGRLRAARWLLGRGAEVNAQSHDMSTALHHACHSGSDTAVVFLLTGAVRYVNVLHLKSFLLFVANSFLL